MLGAGPTTPGVAIADRLIEPVDADGAVLVLGAGCAGLSVAHELIRAGCTAPVVLVDARTGYTDDRTWCFWSTADEPAAALASVAWPSWLVATSAGEVRAGAVDTPYRRVRAIDFYTSVLAALAASPQVHLRLGESVLAVEDPEQPGAAPVVRTSRGIIRPSVLIDATGAAAPSTAQAASGYVRLVQEFLGQTVRTERAVFEPGTCMLMDFRTPQDEGVRFLYVLPTGPTEALVESVHVGTVTTEPDGHRRRITDYLAERYGLRAEDRVVLREEAGSIPMTDHTPPTRVGAKHWSVGLRGGAARPSTGYAFLRIQRSAADVARAIVSASPVPALDGRRRRLLDAVFLRFVADRPAEVPGAFARMFGGTPTPALLRFLSDRSRLQDDLRLILALPKRPFLAALVRVAVHRLAHPSGRRRHAG